MDKTDVPVFHSDCPLVGWLLGHLYVSMSFCRSQGGEGHRRGGRTDLQGSTEQEQSPAGRVPNCAREYLTSVSVSQNIPKL